MPDDYAHILWMEEVIRTLVASNSDTPHPDWDSKESYQSLLVVNAASDFSNLSGNEKRDVVMYLLGVISELSNLKEADDE